ncbi:EB1 protein (macronuclear) [Tetrahymena thermophila SB210]|uniref:EB1 protein n=1 Tax=Tetrahymena thermophila (strain SB210) TaxID=312017 RepID=Q24BP6_TETTS|nr:EB1 protein [Tetrahymena thermophila SB210]EAS05197.1 EB1 protein [Tetrahymena thermophila SB210]|eukprot:XP_001025442.1 EB1 protein [Tetrahymena thermophila SB210]
MSKKLNFGPMDEKCFISRSELLQWINNLLQVQVTKVEQLGSGNIYCQLFDVIYPGKIPLNKLKWKAKHEYEFTHNFKLLQKGFDSVQVAKAIPIEKLVKVKYQDNLEFAQWMKRFFELNCKDKGKGYEAKKRRGFQEPDLSFCGGGVLPQYTMIYGNFKDMEREIAKQNEDEENEEQQQQQSSQPNALGNQQNQTHKQENKNLQNLDKENINSINIIPKKQLLEPALQKFQKSNSDLKPLLSQQNSAKQEYNLNQQQVSPFNPVVSSFLLNQPKKLNQEDSTQQSSNNNSNLECPFFMNNNQFNKYPTLNFQTNQSNITLLKQLESKDESTKNKTPTNSDKIFKESDSVLNSSSSTSSLTDSKSHTSSRLAMFQTEQKLEQIKNILNKQKIDSKLDKEELMQILNSIQTIIY